MALHFMICCILPSNLTTTDLDYSKLSTVSVTGLDTDCESVTEIDTLSDKAFIETQWQSACIHN